MSDTVSTASNTVATALSNASPSCSDDFYKMFKYFAAAVLVVTLVSMIFASKPVEDDSTYVAKRSSHAGDSSSTTVEEFQPRTQPVQHDVLVSEDLSNVQSIPLTAPDTPRQTPENLQFGQATRMVTVKNGNMRYRLDIQCNLPVLGGSVYAEKVEPYAYRVRVTDGADMVDIGALQRDGDGMYKLKLDEADTKRARALAAYVGIGVYLKSAEEQHLVLLGGFKKVTF